MIYCKTCKEGQTSTSYKAFAEKLIKEFKKQHKGHRIEVSKIG